MADPQIEIIRSLLASRPRPAALAERRERLDAFGTRYTVPADVQIDSEVANGVAAEWTITPEADPTRVVMFLHGGAYISGSLVSHRHLVAQVGREARARTLALDYRLAPEHPFPAALEDAVAGYRFGSAAYLTDMNAIPENSMPLLAGVDVLIIDALRWKRHPSHNNVDEALGWVERVGPRQAFFTHIAHELDHAKTEAKLPANVRLAYDGQRIGFEF